MLDENKHVLVEVQTASNRFAITDSALTVAHNTPRPTYDGGLVAYTYIYVCV